MRLTCFDKVVQIELPQTKSVRVVLAALKRLNEMRDPLAPAEVKEEVSEDTYAYQALIDLRATRARCVRGALLVEVGF